MANLVVGKVIILDTVGDVASLFGAGQDRAPLMITKVRWVGGTTAGHAAQVGDNGAAATAIKWDSLCQAANIPQESDFQASPLNFNGLKVLALGSGKLYLYQV